MIPKEAPPAIALVGGGPRAVSVLERIGAQFQSWLPADAARSVRGVIHLIDDVQPGAGRVWRADQPRELCMNTLADAVSLFVDTSVQIAGNAVSGPTLHEWSRLVSGRADWDERVQDPRFAEMLAASPPRAGLLEDFGDELDHQRPDSHPSRALFGEYIAWCYGWVRTTLPPGIVIEEHRARAIDIERTANGQTVWLDDGAGLAVEAVALLPGWLRRAPTERDASLADAVGSDGSLVWIRPDSPADQPLDLVPDGVDVIVRGLGMGFFDTMSLLTLGRGGRFMDGPEGLAYQSSGREPILHVTSRRGLPFRAKSLYGSLPPTAPQRHLRAGRWLEGTGEVDFSTEVWPLILKDAIEEYCRSAPAGVLTVDVDDAVAMIAAASEDADVVCALIPRLIADDFARAELVAALETTTSRASNDAIRDFVAADLDHANAGKDSALKAALWSISAARTLSARGGRFGRFSPASLGDYRRLHAIGGMAGSGPPAFRSRQLLALSRVGLVRFLGGGVDVDVVDGRFLARTNDEPLMEAKVLIDAFMHFHDAESSGDPLIRQLLTRGRLRPFRAGVDRSTFTGGLDVEPNTWRVIDAEGQSDPTMFLAGIPLEQTIGDTIISPLPGSDSTMLRECDAVARGLLEAWSAVTE